MNMDHLNYLRSVANQDVEQIQNKERTYKGSWKKRGGVGAAMMLLRKVDRLENMLEERKYDVFKEPGDGSDGTMIAEIRDLRSYLLLVEAEMVARGVVAMESPDDKWYRETKEKAATEILNSTQIPVHAIGDEEKGRELAMKLMEEAVADEAARPVPLEDSNRHAERAPKLRDGINSYEYGQLPVHQREQYEWRPDRNEWRLKPNA